MVIAASCRPKSECAIQRVLDSDVAMVLDESTPYPATSSKAANSMRPSLRWAERSKRAHEGDQRAVQL